MAHVHELRQRLFIWALSALVGGTIGYFLSDKIQQMLIKPLNQPLFYTSPTGGFDFLIRICIFFGILTSVPVFVYHLLKFIEPTLAKKTRFLIVKLLLASVTLAAIGITFAYMVSLPAALHFLNDFGNSQIKSLISTDEYMSFVMIYLAGYAILFQLPLILLFINRAKPMKPKKLMGAQRYVVLGSFIIAAILTPTPDPVNQSIMAGPMIALYELSIILIWLANRRHKAPAEVDIRPPQLQPAARSIVRASPGPRPVLTPLYNAINDLERTNRKEPLQLLPKSELLPKTAPRSRYALQVPDIPLPQRPQVIANTVPQSVWRAPSGPNIVTLKDKPQPANRRILSSDARLVDLSQMKRDPFYRPSRNVIDMRPKPLGGETI